ncbi:MAG: hypothetical protein ACRDQZ_25270 [Mycobacteriales bacterium]
MDTDPSAMRQPVVTHLSIEITVGVNSMAPDGLISAQRYAVEFALLELRLAHPATCPTWAAQSLIRRRDALLKSGAHAMRGVALDVAARGGARIESDALVQVPLGSLLIDALDAAADFGRDRRGGTVRILAPDFPQLAHGPAKPRPIDVAAFRHDDLRPLLNRFGSEQVVKWLTWRELS